MVETELMRTTILLGRNEGFGIEPSVHGSRTRNGKKTINFGDYRTTTRRRVGERVTDRFHDFLSL